MISKDLFNKIKTAAKVVNAQEKFLTSSLAVKAKKAAEIYPLDASIVQAASILEQSSKSNLFTSRAELNDLYDRLYVNNTKFKQVFAEELNRKELQAPKQYDSYSELLNDYEVVADPVLANALAGIFDGSNEYKPYSKEAASRAEKICNAALMEIDMVPSKISVFAGKNDIFLCNASYETPKGYANVLIPVETKNGSALFPTMFLGQNSFIDLDADKLKSHIISTAGFKFQVNAEGILDTLSQIKNGSKEPVVSDVELALIRLNSEKSAGKEALSVDNSIIGMKLADLTDNSVKDPEYEKTAEHFEFAKRVQNPAGAAEFIHGKQAVSAGRDIIARKMAQFGYKNPQIKVSDCTDKQIKYAISIGVNTGLMTLVDVKDGNVLAPKIAIVSGRVGEFSKDGIRDLIKDNIPDIKALAAASLSAGLKPTELIQQVKDAVAEGNLIKAEDAINVLGDIDKSAQKVAIAILMTGLSNGKKASTLAKEAEKRVYDVPVFNTYNVFYPEE